MLDIPLTDGKTTTKGTFAPVAGTVFRRSVQQFLPPRTAQPLDNAQLPGGGQADNRARRRQSAAADNEAETRLRARQEWQARLSARWAEEEDEATATAADAQSPMDLIYLLAYMELLSGEDQPQRHVIRTHFSLPTDPDE